MSGYSSADETTTTKHKNSTESQLKVALENFRLAAEKCGIDSDTIKEKMDTLKTTIEQRINDSYKAGCDIQSVDKQFRNKKDDFGLTSELATMLRSADTGELAAKKLAKDAMSATKPTAIDTIGSQKATTGFKNTLTLDNSSEYSTSIAKQTTEFVSSASNKSNGNTCGNLNLQTLTGADGKTLFKTLRHAALTTKPIAAATRNPLNKEENAQELATRLCDDLNSKDSAKVASATSELKKYGLDASDFKSIFTGKTDKSALTKKLAKQCGLLNKALDVGRAAWEAQGRTSGQVNITSLSLMTPDRPRAGLDGKGGEVGKLKDQVEAFNLLQNLGAEELQSMGIGSKEAPVSFSVMTFNFGVNEGESLGRVKQQEYNDKAMTRLEVLTQSRIDTLDASLKADGITPEKAAQLTVEKETILALRNDISTSYNTYTTQSADTSKGLWKADQAYDLTAKIAFLTELCDGINTCNCASGKDRTGMHVQNSLNYAASMRDNMASAITARIQNPDGSSSEIDTRSSWEKIKDPSTTSEEKKELQARNLKFLLETGQHDVQEWNTGSPGYKLYSDKMPNMVTNGGQTESFFMEMFGLSKQAVEEKLTMQAKYNAT